ncbi:TonB-dependent receptor (plasmid) [Sphingobium sp. SJ10-10]|uniref:TonB-dependent receptor n=1 Tax=Sphingobium sp. SJ10-10 TaxID=3114999 RepID=UPI002E19FD93|nr:TonB-dependent receptor [Sphingobium sp. SJ10-10]
MKMRTCLIGVSLGALAAPMAHAQTQPDGSPDAASVVSPDEIADIVVTAQKRAERLQDVPIAVSVASATQLESSGVKDLPQLQAIVPGLNVSVANGSFQPSIRGVATNSNIVEQPVSLYIDGVYLPQPQEGLRDIADASQITTLKGPQGTLFGRNATAGVIQITTMGPDFDTHGQFNISYGSYQTVHANAFVTDGLSKDIAVSLSTSYQTQNRGWGKSLTTGKEEGKLDHSYSTRGKILFNLSDATSLQIVGDYLNREDTGSTFQAYPGTQMIYQGFTPGINRYDSFSGSDGYTRFKGGGVAATFKSGLGFANLVSISAYRKSHFAFKFDLGGVAPPILNTTAAGQGRMYSQELQLISDDDGPLKWVLGAYYFNYRQGYNFFYRDFGTGVLLNGSGPYRANPNRQSATLTSFEKSESFAPFAQADFKITPTTTLTGGLRYTYEKRSLDGYGRITNGAGVALTPTHSTPAPLTAKKVTWRFALEQKIFGDAMVFASYSRGFKSGGFNIATPAAPAYLPEQLDDWEVGLKSQFLDRRVTFNVTGFYYKYQNIQVAQFVNNSQTVRNGARAELYGVDVDLTAKLATGLTVSSGLELLHPYFTQYNGAQFGTDNLVSGGVGITAFNAKGQRLAYARKAVLTGAVDYVTQAFGGKVAFNVTATRSGSYFFEPDNVVRQPAYTMLNASVKVSDASDRLSLRFGVSNALDESIISRNVTIGFGRLVSYNSPPREYSLALGMKF